ncbi:MAG: hypothetical protein RID25_23290 [Cyclobacteriaceae bacterium]
MAQHSKTIRSSKKTQDEFTFLGGTHREEIWMWFEEEFQLSVHDDLMFITTA